MPALEHNILTNKLAELKSKANDSALKQENLFKVKVSQFVDYAVGPEQLIKSTLV